jgi:hypothetical protein
MEALSIAGQILPEKRPLKAKPPERARLPVSPRAKRAADTTPKISVISESSLSKPVTPPIEEVRRQQAPDEDGSDLVQDLATEEVMAAPGVVDVDRRVSTCVVQVKSDKGVEVEQFRFGESSKDVVSYRFVDFLLLFYMSGLQPCS